MKCEGGGADPDLSELVTQYGSRLERHHYILRAHEMIQSDKDSDGKVDEQLLQPGDAKLKILAQMKNGLFGLRSLKTMNFY